VTATLAQWLIVFRVSFPSVVFTPLAEFVIFMILYARNTVVSVILVLPVILLAMKCYL